MIRDDIIHMAREAGFDAHDMSDDFSCNVKDIERLVIAAYAAGAKDEREACAKVCEDIEEAYQRQERMRHPILRTDAETGSGECADAIRARGKK